MVQIHFWGLGADPRERFQVEGGFMVKPLVDRRGAIAHTVGAFVSKKE